MYTYKVVPSWAAREEKCPAKGFDDQHVATSAAQQYNGSLPQACLAVYGLADSTWRAEVQHPWCVVEDKGVPTGPTETYMHLKATVEKLQSGETLVAIAKEKLKDVKPKGVKPDITHSIRRGFAYHAARAGEYGTAKYKERGNYLRKRDTIQEAWDDTRNYARATVDHLARMLEAMEIHQATDPFLNDGDGMKAAVLCPDTDKGNENVGPSMLPNVSHAAMSLLMLIEKAVVAGFLPLDPGKTWETT
jgi:hypothetical protein